MKRSNNKQEMKPLNRESCPSGSTNQWNTAIICMTVMLLGSRGTSPWINHIAVRGEQSNMHSVMKLEYNFLPCKPRLATHRFCCFLSEKFYRNESNLEMCVWDELGLCGCWLLTLSEWKFHTNVLLMLLHPLERYFGMLISG